MGKTASKLKARRSQSIAWSFRFPSMSTLQNLGTNGRRKKRDHLSTSVSCKDLRQNRHTIHLQPEVMICDDSTHAVTPLSPATSCADEKWDTGEVDVEEEATGGSACRPGGALKSPSSSAGTRTTSELPTMESSEESTRKLLERELRLLDPRDLRSHAWFHGNTLRGGRKGAENEVPNDGDFLVRDCASQPGNYVLTVRHKGQVLHFVINRLVLQPDTVYERAQYQFEDEAFDTVADLITFYVGSGRPISQASGARIVNPRPRKVPLTSNITARGSQQCSSPSSILSMSSPPRLPRKQQRSHSLTQSEHQQQQQNHSNSIQSTTFPRVPPIPNQIPPTCSMSLGRQKITRVVSDPALRKQQQPLPSMPDKNPCDKPLPSVPQRLLHQPSNIQHETPNVDTSHYQQPSSIHQRLGWDPSEGLPGTPANPPPKPPRHPYVPTHLQGRPIPNSHCHQNHQASGSDSGNGSGDSEFEGNNSGGTAVLPIKGVVIRSHHNATQINGADSEGVLITEEQIIMAAPTHEVPTIYDLEGFNTLLLPTSEHKPLDQTALRGVSDMLHELASRVLASHLTRIDVDVILKPRIEEQDGFLGNLSGLELVTLPQGKQARLDIIERSECLKLLVAVTVLAGATAIERASTISKWIKVAIDTKTALGNLYGYCGVMLGLCLPQIQRLANTWHLLRQRHTDEAFSFEAKLRPTLRAMNECTNPQAPNTTVPHLLPIALLNEREFEDVFVSPATSGLESEILTTWEKSASDCGLSIVWAHLEASRKLAENLPLFRRNAEIALEGCRCDELLQDAFRTEFHLKFLWGSRGSTVGPEERHSKFLQVLDAMYDKCAMTEDSVA